MKHEKQFLEANEWKKFGWFLVIVEIVSFFFDYGLKLWIPVVPMAVYTLILYARKKQDLVVFEKHAHADYIIVIQFLSVVCSMIVGIAFLLLRSLRKAVWYPWVVVGILMLVMWLWFSKRRLRRITFVIYTLQFSP